jgi:hypothetical protein
VDSQAKRDPADEREEIRAYANEYPELDRSATFSEAIGRIPPGPARGWRARERKAKTCDACEGDLWVEDGDGNLVPCGCRGRRAARRAANRLRAGDWWLGMSLSFAAPPLSAISVSVRDAIETLCADIKQGRRSEGLWIIGGPGSGKSALCAYIAQRLYPTNDAVIERVGNLFAHLRWLGAVKGENAVERRVQKLVGTPLLVLDDLDRAIRSHPPASPLTLRESCASQDLIRLAMLLRERHAAELPTVVASRSLPAECVDRTTAITRLDLVRGLVAIASGATSPFEDFPAYSLASLDSAMRELRQTCATYSLDERQPLAAAA